jgi:nucleotidyltransferase substrate binding protein (TIGR01987 family)
LLNQEGIQINTPRESLQKAYEIRWIEDETAWLQMLKDRNETSHIYDEEMAKRIYLRIKQNFPQMESTYALLLKRYGG